MPTLRQSGFTLLELMVAVAIFILLTVMAVPSFTTYMEKSRVRGAADAVVDMVAQARQAAVKYDRGVSLTTTGSGATWCLGARQAVTPAVGSQAVAAPACDCTAAANASDACIVDARLLVTGSTGHAGITLSSAASAMAFDGRLGIRNDGNIANADASSFDLTSQNGRYVLTVAVSPLGQASVCSKTGNILGYPAC